MTAPTPQELRDRLLAWYKVSRRDLPWRGETDAYRIWLSEVMLQQTRVEAVRPYYQRFVVEFPDLGSLAAARPERVLELWSGLGYYQRARAFHEAVKECDSRYLGKVPSDPARFRELRGVGPYTTAAVMSIAYDLPLAVVDGNVVRVLTRLFAWPGHARERRLVEQVQAFASSLVPKSGAGDFNQAMMELGATVCTPRAPRCVECPWQLDCMAYATASPGNFPTPAPRKPIRTVSWTAAVVTSGKGIWFVRRPRRGRLAGMWELPWREGEGRARIVVGDFAIPLGAVLGEIKHSILDQRISLTLRAGHAEILPAAGDDFRWVDLSDPGDLAVSSLWRKALKLLHRQSRAG